MPLRSERFISPTAMISTMAYAMPKVCQMTSPPRMRGSSRMISVLNTKLRRILMMSASCERLLEYM